MEALHDVVKAGYVRYLGMSSCWAWQCKSPAVYTGELMIILCSRLVSIMQSKALRQDAMTHLAHMDADYAITNNLTPFISMQNHYSLLYREEEREMMPTLKVCQKCVVIEPECPKLPSAFRRRLYSLEFPCSRYSDTSA